MRHRRELPTLSAPSRRSTACGMPSSSRRGTGCRSASRSPPKARGAGLLLRRRSEDRIDERARFVDGVLKLEYDFLNTTLEARLSGDELIGAYRNNRAGARPQDVRMRRFTPAAIADDNTPALAGNWEMRRQRRRSHRAARHAHLARVSAPVGRRSVRHDSAGRRRHRHAGRALAERQADAQPFRRRAAEPVRGDARRRRHARRHAQRHRALSSSCAAARRAPRGFPNRRIRRATPTSRIRSRRSISRSRI